MKKTDLFQLKNKIMGLSDHQNPNVRRFVALAVREFHIADNVVPLLNKYLVDKQWPVRIEAARTLRYVDQGKDSAVSFIAKRLGVDYMELRGAVMSILSGNVATEKEGDLAKKELVAEVKTELAVSAAWLDHSLVLDPLISSLSSENVNLRVAGAVGLGNVGHPKAVEPLIAVARKEQEELRIRKSAIVSLGKLKAFAAAEALIAFSSDSHDEIRREAVIALNAIKPAGAEDVFLRTIKDDSPLVREVSVIALGNLKNRDHLLEIAGLLSDIQPNVRKAAAEVLGNLRETAIAPYLIERLDDHHELVQNEVMLAYFKIPRLTGTLDMEDILQDKESPAAGEAGDQPKETV